MLSPRFLAAAAVVVAAVVGIVAVIATAAEQDQQDDDPAQITTAEVVVTHKEYLQIFLSSFAAHSKIFRCAKKVTADAGHPPMRFWRRSFRPSF